MVNKHDEDTTLKQFGLFSPPSPLPMHEATRKESGIMKKSLLPQRTPSKRGPQGSTTTRSVDDVVEAREPRASRLPTEKRKLGHYAPSAASTPVTSRKDSEALEAGRYAKANASQSKIRRPGEQYDQSSGSSSRSEAKGILGRSNTIATPSTSLDRPSSIRRPAPSAASSGNPKHESHIRNHSTEHSRVVKPRSNTISTRSGISHGQTPDQSVSVSSSASVTRSNTPQSFESSTPNPLQPEGRTRGVAGNDRSETSTKGHSRTRSQPTIIQKDTPLTRSKSTLVKVSQTRSATTRPSRPPFTTLQQHYSPKKITRTPTSSSNSRPQEGAGSEQPLTLESLRVQVELLQLHLLHQTAKGSITFWERSAEQQLEKKFGVVLSKYNDLQEIQQKNQQRKDAAALKSWLGGSHIGSGEQTQTLARLLQDISQVSDPEGRFTRQGRYFDHWLNYVESVWQERHRSDVNVRSLRFVDGLENSWRNEGFSLSRRMTAWLEELENLGTVVCGSSLSAAVDICKSLVRDMSSELEGMRQLEKDIMQQEQEWVRCMTDQARRVVADDERPKEHCPVWDED
ncbi:hypothetical protein L228DRAFT_61820 [Xylona heveae TC161]|uniref:Uncharacterized protein n=1 Tax=Xylona heveae (strain CBS 132557 / TC161) TaxID=1328760 RepID=A0A165IM22_XYLHT|nr:hypothetical protein L228DRAFT_61820 [Xylona heveae TC161]KZF25091.1 hypothetical protein L228DRAFT_61820 [Xylona heveae TC161]